jgi:hypothetical protein
MSSGDWRETWEQHADGARKKLDAMSIRELCTRIQAGKVDDYHQVWQTIAERATLSEVGWFLYSILESDREYLDRYHCAAALLHLLNERQLTAVDLSAGWGKDKNLPTIASLLEQRIGPRK